MQEDLTSKAMQRFMKNITQLRKQHGLSKKAMAKILGIGVGSLTMIERGEMPKRLSGNAIYGAVHHFGISVDTLFEGTV